MKKQLLLATIAFALLFPAPVSAKFWPFMKPKKEVKQNIMEQKKDLKGKGIKIIDGTVTAKTSTSLTVTKDGKTFTVNVDSKSKFRRHFWGKSAHDEISVGDHVNVWGRFTDDAQTTILAMMIRDLSIQKRKGAFLGTVSSKQTDSFVMHTVNRGDQTVMVGSNTKFIKRNGEAMTFADLQVNDRVRVKGLWDKTLNKITDVAEVKDFSLPPKPAPTP